jgi:predicted enzyme related to lactoylglutathione lyase
LKFTDVTTVVLVQDLDRALRFYRDVLGFTVQEETEEWVMFTQRVGLMLSPEPLPVDNINVNAVMLSLHVEDVQATYYELIEKGVPFIIAPTDIGDAKVATLRDPEGNVLQLIQAYHG